MITAGVQGRGSGAGGEEMEDREEMETESTSNVPILAAGGTFKAAFKVQQKEPRVRMLLDNSSAGQSAEQNLTTPNATANAGNAAGASRHETSILRMGRMVIGDLGHDWFGCTDHRLEKTGGVLANCTDRESDMCKMGRMVIEDLGHDWFGSTDHRLEKTAGASKDESVRIQEDIENGVTSRLGSCPRRGRCH